MAAAVVRAGRVRRQLPDDLVNAGYTVLEIAICPDLGKEADVPAAISR